MTKFADTLELWQTSLMQARLWELFRYLKDKENI